MRRPSPRCAALSVALFLLGTAVFGQAPVTFDWNAGLQTTGTLSDPGTGVAGDWQDSLSLGLELAHGAGRGLMTYRLAGEMQYAPQQIAPGAPPVSALTAYPTESGIGFELPPKRLVGLWFRAVLGRVGLNDPTGLLLYDPDALVPGQLADGLLLEFRFQQFSFAAGAGYLGFLDKRLNRVRFTPEDQGELVDSTVYFAPPRGLAILRLEAADLFAGQHVALFGVGQKDFRPVTPTFDSWYAGAVVAGPIALGFRHRSTLIAGITAASGAQTGVGFLLDEVVAYRIPVAFLHEAWFSALWASTAAGGLSAFPALAGPLEGGDFPLTLSDLVRLELGIDSSFAAVPAGALLTPAFAARLLFRPSGSTPAGLAVAPAGSYLGTELELSAGLQPVSGLGFTARGGVLIAPAAVLPYARLHAEVRL
jgi:hypothetical protein